MSREELYGILHCRQEVFTVEQNIVYQDLDYLDQKSIHMIIKDGESIAAYLRIIDPGAKFREVSIGRLLTTGAHRGKGLGRRIMQEALEFIKAHYQESVKIDAQEYLVKFYESLGFEKTSEPFILEGIRHVEMVLP